MVGVLEVISQYPLSEFSSEQAKAPLCKLISHLLWASMAARTITSSRSTLTPITSFKPLLLQGQRMRSDSSTKLEATFPLEENALYVILIQNSTCEHLRIEGVRHW